MAIALILVIEIAAREVFFGLVFMNAIFLFSPPVMHRWALPVVVALLGILTVATGVHPRDHLLLMAAARETTIVHVALLAFTLWPLVHIGLVWRFDLSPWKLAGWGMYSAPRFGTLGMELYGHDATRDQWQQLTTPTAPLQTAAAAFLERHRWLRGLAGDHGLVTAVRVDHPEWDALRIVVAYPEIDRQTGYVVWRHDERLPSSRSGRRGKP